MQNNSSVVEHFVDTKKVFLDLVNLKILLLLMLIYFTGGAFRTAVKGKNNYLINTL